MNSKKAFTIIELMVVIVIIGILAVIALPKFKLTVDRAIESDAINKLMTIHAANKIYFAQTGGYFAGNLDVNGINSSLAINIIPDNMTYSYTGNANNYTATATRSSGDAFIMSVTEVPLSKGVGAGTGNPCCSGGSCPTTDNQC